MPFKPIVSNKRSQEVTVRRGAGCVVIRVKVLKTNQTQSVTVFDECLTTLIAQLCMTAGLRAAELRNEVVDAGADDHTKSLSTED